LFALNDFRSIFQEGYQLLCLMAHTLTHAPTEAAAAPCHYQKYFLRQKRQCRQQRQQQQHPPAVGPVNDILLSS
jgi:hypothetical protein